MTQLNDTVLQNTGQHLPLTELIEIDLTKPSVELTSMMISKIRSKYSDFHYIRILK